MASRRTVIGGEEGVAEIALDSSLSTYVDVPFTRQAVSGELVGVVARLTTLDSNGAPSETTITDLRVRVGSLRQCSSITNGANLPDEASCFDSGTVASPTPSATAADIEEYFGGANGDPSPFTGGMRVFVNWAHAAGGNRVLKIALLWRDLSGAA